MVAVAVTLVAMVVAVALVKAPGQKIWGGVERGEHNLTLIGLTKIAKALHTKPPALLDQAGF